MNTSSAGGICRRIKVWTLAIWIVWDASVSRCCACTSATSLRKPASTAVSSTASSKPAERIEVRRKFASGDYAVVCNVGVLTMGVDWDVRCIILARPTKSEMLFVQIIGRGLRPAADKDHCLILDHSDTTSRLGFVTDIHHDELDDGDRRISSARDRVKLPKECPMCACLRPPTTMFARTVVSRQSRSTRCA
jgi:superfamily II DNA or RNA helicase